MKSRNIIKRLMALVLSLALLLGEVPAVPTVLEAQAQPENEDELGFITEVPTITNGNASNWNDNESYNKLLDGDTSTKYGLGNKTPYVEFYYSNPITPKGYALWTANDSEGERNPGSWTISAKKNEGDEWTELVTVDNSDGLKLPKMNYKRTLFTLDNDTAYKYFRFQAGLSANNGFQLAELQFFTTSIFGNLNYATVNGLDNAYGYADGNEIVPDYTVIGPEGNVLEKDRDYDAVITNIFNEPVESITEPGRYTLTISGKGGYTGSITQTFRVISNITLGTEVISNPIVPGTEGDKNGWQGNYVYYGKYDGYEYTKYRILDKSSVDFGVEGGSMLLDCDTILGETEFDADSSAWPSSSIKKKLNGDGFLYKAGNFTSAERAAIAVSVKAEPISGENGDGNGAEGLEWIGLSNSETDPVDRIFLLDAKEVTRESYGYRNTSSDDNKKGKSGTAKCTWWLRSQDKSGMAYNGNINDHNEVVRTETNDYSGVSPAFNISLSSVIFSRIMTGVLDVGLPGAAYILTVSDNNLQINAGNITKEDNVITVSYSITDNSEDATPNLVSVLVVGGGEWTENGWSKGSEILLYEALGEDFALSGTESFTLPDSVANAVWGEDYHVYILAEATNDDPKRTEYASEPYEIKLIDAESKGYEGTYDGQPHGISVTVSDPVSGATVKYGTTSENCVLNEGPVVTDVNEAADTVYYQITAPGYVSVKGSATIKINKADPSLTAPAAKEGLIASDAALELITAGKTESGELLYALGTDDKTVPTEGWSKDIPKAREAGTYYVWYKVTGDKNHKDKEPECVKVIIKEKEEMIADSVNEKQEKVSESVKDTINDMPVSANLSVSYPKAVEWTGKKITKSQLEALLGEGEALAKLNISGLEEALKGKMKEGTDISKFFSYSITISKDKNVDTTGYFTVKVKLNSKAVKKAKIKGADKKALAKLVKALNEKLKDTKFEYKIAPLKLAEAESVTIKAKLKKGALQLDEQGGLKGLKSIKVKTKIKGLKKARTFTYSAKKAAAAFSIKITDAAAKTAELTAVEGKGFSGSKGDISITK